MIKRILSALLLFGVLAAPGWIIQGGVPCVTDRTFSVPGAYIYTGCSTTSLTVEATGGGSGGGRMSLAHSGGPGGNGAAYAADSLSFTAGATYNVIVGTPGDGSAASIISVPGTISYVCATSIAACTTSLNTCADRVGLTLGTWVCAENEDGGGTGSVGHNGGSGGAGGSGGGSSAGGGAGGGSSAGDGSNGTVGGNNCSSTGGAGGSPGGGKGGDGVICAGLDGSPGDNGTVPGAGGGGGGGGTNSVQGGNGFPGEVKIHS